MQKRSEIYQKALRKFRHDNPEYDAVTYLASLMGLSTNTLYQKLADDERHFSIVEEERFFELCGFPEGFTYKRIFVFGAKERP